MPVVKTSIQLAAQLVTFTTTLPIAQVLARLDVELSRDKASVLFPLIRASTSKESLESGLREITDGNDFVFFLQMEHTSWMRLYHDSMPRAVVYTIGNPVIAQTMLRHDMRGAYNIPPRLLILERVDAASTDIIYHLPSSVIVLDDSTNELLDAARILDDKLEQLVRRVTED